jgi:hypothetical protein
MFDTIILLTGPVEEGVLASVLREHNPRLVICGVKSLEDLETLKPEVLSRARLIGFVTPVIVPQGILKSLGYGAYNFHPGPPHYPGWMPSHFATYDGATEFGATAHVMDERVDTGPIIGVELFNVRPNTTVVDLEQQALVSVARLFWKLANVLATHGAPLNPIEMTWSGHRTTRRNYTALCEVSAEISKEELERRIGVFGSGHFGQSPTITLHGHRFRYVASEVEAPSIVPEDSGAEPAPTALAPPATSP